MLQLWAGRGQTEQENLKCRAPKRTS
jgi:hypothetical protein